MPRALRVTVVALTFGGHSQLPDGALKTALLAAGADYDPLTQGYVYGDSPDEWAPGRERGARAPVPARDRHRNQAPLSSYIGKPDCLLELTRNTDLYIFDPVFLNCPGKRAPHQPSGWGHLRHHGTSGLYVAARPNAENLARLVPSGFIDRLPLIRGRSTRPIATVWCSTWRWPGT